MASLDLSLSCIDFMVLVSRCEFLLGGGIVVEVVDVVGDLSSEIITFSGRSERDSSFCFKGQCC